MKTLVLGGGVVGVTTAYFRARAGHEVTVLDEKDGLGLEATAGNAGIIAPGHSFAWASPRAPRMLWQSLRGAETAIRVRLTADPRLYAWGLRFLRECTSGRARRNTLIKLRLCQYSESVLNELVRAEGIEYQAIHKGALYLHRDPAELEAGIKKMALLAERVSSDEEADVTTYATKNSGEAQAQRLERVYEEVAQLLREPGVASRLRTPPGGNEWSGMQTLGHMTEMIPYWLNHCRALIAATGTPPTFGRTHGSPERLAGIAHGATADPDTLLGQLHEEVRAAASVIRQLSIAERGKRGISTERGEMTVAEVIESFIVDHAEEHLAQVQIALRA